MDADEIRDRWTVRDGEYSPAYYAYYGPNEISERLRELLGRFVGTDAPILELGCSSGRHLAHLHEHGFRDLSGVDVNENAFDVMSDTYPELAAEGTFYHGGIEDVLTDFEDNAFDVVYSVETLQHLHPELEGVFEEISRITSDLLITVENERDDADQAQGTGDGDSVDGENDVTHLAVGVPLFHRNWNQIFARVGFEEVESQPGRNTTTRTYRPAGE